ncbi:MAG: glycosyltransferase family 4 protein [Acidimicrobiales bacterium]|jgi:glycosyltransferase involved in cell wall biosynthesis
MGWDEDTWRLRGARKRRKPDGRGTGEPDRPGLSDNDAPPTSERQRPIAVLEFPVDGSVEDGGVIQVSGWGAGVGDIDRIEVRLDDGPSEPAGIFCTVRPDVIANTGDPSDLLSGYFHLVDVGSRPVGSTCTVTVEVVGESGRNSLGSRSVVIGPTARQLGDAERAWVEALSDRTGALAKTAVPGDGLRLMVVAHELSLGGAQLWLQEILRTLLTRPDVSCTVLSHHDSYFRSELEEAGAVVHVIGRLVETGGAYESQVRDVVDLMVADGTNIVLANAASSFIGVDAAARCGIPSVYAIHDHFSENILWDVIFGRLGLDEHVRRRTRVALEGATAVGFVADATRRLYLPDDEDERAVRVDYGIRLGDVERSRATLDRTRLRAEHGYRPDDRVLINVATVNPRKAQAMLVVAFARIAGDHPEARLAMVGAGGNEYAGATAELIDLLGLGGLVRQVPLTPDVEPWYVMADGFVLPSDTESLPRTIIEAMAFEVPVLASDVGGVSEIVRQGETGLLHRPGDVADLARGLDRLLSLTPAEAGTMTDRAAAETRSVRDVHGYVATYEHLLRGLAKDPGASPRQLVAER